MIRFNSFVAATVVLLPSLAFGADFLGKVVGVIDGDSIRVMHDGKAEQVRLNGIDCPEKGQAFGTRAKQATSSLAFGNDVTVKTTTKDRYGRTVADVILPGGMNLNRELVKQGWCWWFRKYAPYDTVLSDLEAEARRGRLGVWADPHPVPPWEFRKARAKRRNEEGKASNQNLLNDHTIAVDPTNKILPPRHTGAGMEDGLRVLGNRRSHLYHRADCPNYSEIAVKNQVKFTSELEAQEAGYRVAGNCP